MVMRLYVGGLSYQTDEDTLRDLFAQAGEVTDVHIIEDWETGRSKGFGFVEMPDEEARQAIARFDGARLDGRTLTVNEVRPREERAATSVVGVVTAAGVTGVARTLGAALAPVLAGPLLASPALLGAPFFLAGGIKIAYDLLLYRGYRGFSEDDRPGEAA